MTAAAGLQPRADALVEIRGLSVRYSGLTAVDDVSLDIERGLLTALVGPSGCGKTSLLRAIAGLETPASGTVRIDGEVVFAEGRGLPAQKRQVGMVFQQGALFPHLSVRRNVRYGVDRRPDADALTAAALRVVGLEGLGERYPDELSGGEQQRVALARALAPSPRIVLLDEPFANLDAGLRVRVRAEVRSILEQAGTTAVLVTHDQEEALSVADRVAVMASGRVLQIGTPDQIYRDPSSLEVARFFGEGQLVRCRIEAGRARSVYGETPSSADGGEGWLWVRPEDFVLDGGAGDGRPIEGEVVAERFFGHDLLQQVRMDSGDSIWVRNLAPGDLAVGGRVSVRLRSQPLRVFRDEDLTRAESADVLTPRA